MMGGKQRSKIARLNGDGTIDDTFNPGANGDVHAMAIQSDGKILVGGHFTTLAGQTRDRIGQLYPDGSLDLFVNPAANNIVNSIAVQPDGRILAGGDFTSIGGQTSSRISRLNNSAPATSQLSFDGSNLMGCEEEPGQRHGAPPSRNQPTDPIGRCWVQARAS